MWEYLNRREMIVSGVIGSIELFATSEATSRAEDVAVKTESVLDVRRRRAIENAVNFLGDQQYEDGSYGEMVLVGVTSLVVSGLMSVGVKRTDPMVGDGLDYIVSKVKPDGGIYSDQRGFPAYETSLAIMTLVQADREKYRKTIDAAVECLRREQWDEGESIDESDPSYGGAGYGGQTRPDLSNTQFFMDALHDAGAGPDDPAIQKALKFVSRCQNLESEHNTSANAAAINDGGFLYTPVAGGSSPAGRGPQGGLRSYGSMTYAGLKSMIYAGLTPDDIRVRAAIEWLRKFYTLDENPGMGEGGLFYYYHTISKSLDLLGQIEDTQMFTDINGVSHDWKTELTEAILKRQLEDGSWVNTNPRWMENDPVIVTGFALMTLGYIMKKSNE
ncbi:MAG: terpene cyclase/mutase family protein [Planctomycetia bacterium]|nr:terpene cyclase/mutase family protein [Planctomycetia bacterium]